MDEVLDVVERCSEDVGIPTDPQDYLDDIRKITCLVIQDGRRLEFVHASIAHYFSSRYVKSRTEIIGQRFYEQLLDGKWISWVEEIKFLAQIDTHRFYKYFLIPDMDSVLLYFGASKEERESNVIKYLRSLKIEKKPSSESPSGFKYFVSHEDVFHRHSMTSLRDGIFSVLFIHPHDGAASWRRSFEMNASEHARSYYDIAVDRGGGVDELLVRVVEKFLEDVSRNKKIFEKHVEKGDNVSDFVSLE